MATQRATRGKRGNGAHSDRRARIQVRFTTDGDRTPGLELVEHLLATGKSTSDVLTPKVAAQAIDALEALELPHMVVEMIRSGERFAEQVHSKATRGLQEVVQNADDQRASHLRFGFRTRGRIRELLVAHDGKPVEVRDVLDMAWPLLSGSRKDADKIGRFGIGLKTLNQFGERLAVHCPPLPGFEIQGGQVRRINSAAAIRGFWNPRTRETLFVLRLEDARFDLAFFKEWLADWDASSLLFLKTLTNVSLIDLTRRRKLVERGVTQSRTKSVDLDLPGATEVEQVTLKDASSSRAWVRYSVRLPRPKSLKATHKNVGDTVRLQIAVPRRPEPGRLFVGLPLDEPCDLPYSLSGPFEPNVDRTQLRDNNKLNEWLIGRIGDFATAISIRRFADQPKSGWLSVPLPTEGAGATEWTRTQFARMLDRQRKRVSQKVRLKLSDGAEIRLGNLTYEPRPFEGLLDETDIERLWDQTSSQYGRRRAVPKDFRDPTGRWRKVLEPDDLDASPLYSGEIVEMLDWPDADIASRGSRWLLDFVGASLDEDLEEELWQRRCVAIAGDGGRRSPAEIASGGTLLVHTLPREGLAASLGLAVQIARAFRSHDDVGEKVRSWLVAKHVLRGKATDGDALGALSRASREEPIDLSRRHDVLQRLRNSFEQLPADERSAIGPSIGANIAVAGHEFQGGKRKSRSVRLAEAYLPSRIDKNAGWPMAAAQTPGILWVDPSYSVTLAARRGQGALATLKALGAATAPRLQPGPPPDPNPHAPRLARSKEVCAQHREELSACPDATGLLNDWVSPDLDSVLADMLREKRSTVRRKRARALFLALDRAWDDYAERATAQAVHHYYGWQLDGEVSATWIAKAASEPWLSTREARFTPASPRELTVLTEAAFEIEGESVEKYAYEIEPEQVDSPAVEALQIQGRPFASSIVDRLVELREAEEGGTSIEQGWADRCYSALASYCPGGSYADRSDLSVTQLRRHFASGRGKRGLIRTSEGWLSAPYVRRDPFLDASLPHVHGADALWDLLGIQPPTTADCVRIIERLAARKETNPSSELLVFRHLLTLAGTRKLQRKELLRMPLRTYSGWRSRKGITYAVDVPALAEALGARWPVWQPPMPLDALTPLIGPLGIRVLPKTSFKADIPSRVAVGGDDLRAGFASAVTHLNDYLAVNHPELHARLSAGRWSDLAEAEVIAGSGWAIVARAGRRRPLRLTVRAYLFEDPLRLCALHEDEIGERESGGLAIAGYFVGDDPAPEDRSTLALAWADAYRKRDEAAVEIKLGDPTEPEGTVDEEAFKKFRGQSGGRRKTRRRRPPKRAQPPREPPRELIDPDDLDLSQVVGTVLDGKRRGQVRTSPKAKLKRPRKRMQDKSRAPSSRAGQRHYTDRDREDLAYDLIATIFDDLYGLELEDIRDDHSAGADAFDQKRDVWVELKAHGQEPPDTLRLEPSEALRAKQKRGNYWLVVVWNLEKPRTPCYSVVRDPLERLDVYLGAGLKLAGLRELTESPNA